MTEHYDVVIIGSGAGGGTLAHTLAATGRQILILEGALIRADADFLAFLESFQRGCVAKDLGCAFDCLGKRAPDARILVRLAAELAHVLPQVVGGLPMFGMNLPQRRRPRLVAHFFKGLLIGFRCGQLAAQ